MISIAAIGKKTSALPRKSATLWRYLKDPCTYPFLWRRLGCLFFSRPSDLNSSGDQARRWCAAKAVGREDFMISMSLPVPLMRVDERFPEIWRHAKSRTLSVGLKMGGPGEVDLLYHLVRELGCRIVVETGVAHGWSSLAILLALQDRPGAMLFSSNLPYREQENEADTGRAVPEDLLAQWRLCHGADNDVLPKILEEAGEVDLCHYDSNKSYAGRMWAYRELWEALRMGGIFLSDDVGDNLAFKHFSILTGEHAYILRKDITGDTPQYVGILVKRSGRPLRQLVF